ncbi:VanZ family protein [Lactiplantibacillus songbeiensis]|uniref:VanZ family protein n=1 Tax=Lactiplantibacillus songbeiensis TaxID=2559920 RepID=A0ABW4C032_9LACO|nr:VanZ family protein [Lactiplantibacillus songbeiensis]
MRWKPLLFILLIAGLSGLLILIVGHRHRWLALLKLAYFTGLATILFTPISFSGTSLYMMPIGIGRVNLTNFSFSNLGFWENVILTLPLGLLLKRMWPRLSLFGVGFVGLMIGSSIEITQYFLAHHYLINRSSDINDILANALGILIGGLVIAGYLRLTAWHRQRVNRRLAS